MPLPSDEQLVKTSGDVVAQMQAIFGKHPGIRPAHGKGIMLTGSFTPTAAAKTLSTAPHLTAASTPITARFSNSTGLPAIPDADPNGDPRGLAVRFNLAPHTHTDIVCHSTPFFPTRTGADFLAFLRALAASPPDAAHPTPAEQFLAANPAALAFVQAPKPTPASYASDEYFGVTAFRLVDAAGKGTFVRYRVVPAEGGVQSLDAAALESKGADFLQQEIAARVEKAPAVLKLCAQVAEEGDVVDDATVRWPEARKLVELGEIQLDAVLPDNAKEQKHIIFDPLPRVKGVEPSADPLLEFRAAVYLISGRQRRAA